MTWRNRKLFNNLPQGIVSGLEPIPRYKEGGFVNPRNYVGGGTVEYPIGMEMGSLVPEVFESGDQQINEALNNALSVTGVTNDMMTKKVPTMTVSKSPQMNATDSSFDSSVETITEEYETAAKQLIQESMINPSVNQEDLEKVLEAKFTLLDEEYKTKIKELASELNMPLDQTQVETLTLFTPNFKEELDNLVETADKEIDEVISNEGPNKLIKTANIPGLEQGGLKEDDFVGQLKNQMVDSSRKKFMDLINEGNEVQMLQTGGEVDDLEKIKNLYGEFSNLPINDSLTRERMNLYRTGKLMSGKTLQGGIGGAFDVIGQSNISAGEGMGTTPETQTRISGDLLEKSLDAALGLEFPTGSQMTADERREARVAEILSMPPGPVRDSLLKVYSAYIKQDSVADRRAKAIEQVLAIKRGNRPKYEVGTAEFNEKVNEVAALLGPRFLKLNNEVFYATGEFNRLGQQIYRSDSGKEAVDE